MTEDYIIKTPASVIKGRNEFKNGVKEFQQLLPEAKTENVDIIFNEIYLLIN